MAGAHVVGDLVARWTDALVTAVCVDAAVTAATAARPTLVYVCT